VSEYKFVVMMMMKMIVIEVPVGNTVMFKIENSDGTMTGTV